MHKNPTTAWGYSKVCVVLGTIYIHLSEYFVYSIQTFRYIILHDFGLGILVLIFCPKRLSGVS